MVIRMRGFVLWTGRSGLRFVGCYSSKPAVLTTPQPPSSTPLWWAEGLLIVVFKNGALDSSKRLNSIIKHKKQSRLDYTNTDILKKCYRITSELLVWTLNR